MFNYEIELKALLTKEKYISLIEELSKRMKLINRESLHTRKFKNEKKDDIRLRFSETRCECVHKEGHATEITRKESIINLVSKQDLDEFGELLKRMNFSEDPSWITHRYDFEYEYEGDIYSISLQHTENFAYILEVEFITDEKDKIDFYERKIKKIMSELECDAINASEFSKKIQLYIENNKNNLN